MAWLVWQWAVQYGQGDTRSISLAHRLLDHYTSCLPVQSILDKFDIHNECHDTVGRQIPVVVHLLIYHSIAIILAFISLISWFVRYRFLNMYARLPLEPQRKEPQIDLFPDTQEGDSKPGLANYLDEFLSAIKVFGYRE